VDLQYTTISIRKQDGTTLGSENLNPDGTWSVGIEPCSESTPVVMYVSGSTSDSKSFICTFDSSVFNEDIINVNLDALMIQLSGSFTYLVNGVSPEIDYCYVYLYKSGVNGSISSVRVDDSGNWDMLVQSTAAPFNPVFSVSGQLISGSYFSCSTEN
jgi:hypothetical protein